MSGLDAGAVRPANLVCRAGGDYPHHAAVRAACVSVESTLVFRNSAIKNQNEKFAQLCHPFGVGRIFIGVAFRGSRGLDPRLIFANPAGWMREERGGLDELVWRVGCGCSAAVECGWNAAVGCWTSPGGVLFQDFAELASKFRIL
jgi:hypothetical protein